MRLLYIIQAHKSPEQLLLLIDKLNDVNVFFYIHIDKKSDLSIFESIVGNKSNVRFIDNRIDCIWGDFSQVQATINLMNELALTIQEDKYFVIFISGQDYPLRNKSAITSFFESNREFNFINVKDINKIWKKPGVRTRRFKVNFSSKRGDFVILRPFSPYSLWYLVTGKISLDLAKEIMKFRSSPIYPHYGGSNWWALNGDTFEMLLKYINDNMEKLYNYYKFSISADEIFFQTIIMHLSRQYQNINIKPTISYANWSRLNCDLPVTFTISDIEELKDASAEFLFARKLDIDIDRGIFKFLDQDLLVN